MVLLNALWITIGIVSILILIIFSAFFSASEMAFVTANRAIIRKKAQKKDNNAVILDRLLKEPNKVINTIVIGTNIVNTLSSVIAGSLATMVFGSVGIGIATAVMTFLLVILCEVTPKALGLRNEKFLLKLAKPIYFLTKAFQPMTVVLVYIAKNFTKFLGDKHKSKIVTEEEIEAMVELGAEEGAIEEEEKEIVREALNFDDTSISEVRIPKNEIESLNEKDTIKKLIKKSKKTGYSRFPVYKKDIDNITGMVHIKDSLDRKESTPLYKIKRDILEVKLIMKSYDVLKSMRESRTQIAVIKSFSGKTLGIVTMEDLMEKIFGDIMDEHDKKIKR